MSGSEIKEIYNPGLRNLITVLDGNVTDGIRRWGSGKDGDIIFFLGSILLLLFLLGMIAAMTTRSDGEASLEWGTSMKSATGLDWFYQ